MKKQNLEKILAQYLIQTKRKLNFDNESTKNSSNVKLNQQNMKEIISVLNAFQKDEITKLKL